MNMLITLFHRLNFEPPFNSRKAERSYCTFKVRRGGGEEISLVQGKEQQLRIAGSHEKIPHDQGKRNPSKTVGVARGHQRADTLKP